MLGYKASDGSYYPVSAVRSDGEAIRPAKSDPMAMAPGLSPAVENFLFPYYAFQRLLTDEEMQRLKESFRNEKVVAIWHQAPSRPVLQYANVTADETIAVLVAESDKNGEIRTEWRGIRDFLSAPAMS